MSNILEAASNLPSLFIVSWSIDIIFFLLFVVFVVRGFVKIITKEARRNER